jgi:hypothetical protein
MVSANAESALHLQLAGALAGVTRQLHVLQQELYMLHLAGPNTNMATTYSSVTGPRSHQLAAHQLCCQLLLDVRCCCRQS